jgi:hypothetical protein
MNDAPERLVKLSECRNLGVDGPTRLSAMRVSLIVADAQGGYPRRTRGEE